MLDLLNGDNDAGDRYAPTGGCKTSTLAFRERCRKCKVGTCAGLIGGLVNHVAYSDDSDSMYEAVRALHVRKFSTYTNTRAHTGMS